MRSTARDARRSLTRGFSESERPAPRYDATRPGAGGGGGEYAPQVGFGWSNGVALEFLARFGDALRAGDGDPPGDPPRGCAPERD